MLNFEKNSHICSWLYLTIVGLWAKNADSWPAWPIQHCSPIRPHNSSWVTHEPLTHYQLCFHCLAVVVGHSRLKILSSNRIIEYSAYKQCYKVSKQPHSPNELSWNLWNWNNAFTTHYRKILRLYGCRYPAVDNPCTNSTMTDIPEEPLIDRYQRHLELPNHITISG